MLDDDIKIVDNLVSNISYENERDSWHEAECAADTKADSNKKEKPCKHEPGCLNYMGTDYICKKCGLDCGMSESC